MPVIRVRTVSASIGFALCCCFTVSAQAGLQNTATSLSASPNPVALDRSVTLTAVMTPAAATGKVSFYDATNVIGSATIQNGKAVFTTNLLPGGKQSIFARYQGNATFAISVSAPISLTVSATPANAFLAPSIYPAGSGPTVFASGDFNGDGILDLAVGDANDGSLSILLGNAAGGFATTATYPQLFVSSIVVADFDGDGKQDIVVEGNGPVFLHGNGDGTFQQTGSFAQPGLGCGDSLAVGDFNGDGLPDLLFSCSNNQNALILLNQKNGVFGSPQTLAVGPLSVAVADFNGDGFADIYIQSGAAVLVNNGNNTYTQVANPSGGTGLGAVTATGDFNEDGYLDIAFMDPFDSNGIQIQLGTGASAASGNPLLGPPMALGGGFFENQGVLTVGDFNGDGHLDILVSGTGAQWMVFPGNGNGTFGTMINFPAPQTLYPINGLLTGDFNGDGRTDFAALNTASNQIEVLLGASQSMVSLTVNPAPPSPGAQTTLTASITPATATGSVTFSDGSTVLGTAPVISGAANFPTTALGANGNFLTASYSGDATDLPNSGSITVNVPGTPTATTLISSSQTEVLGEPAVFTATVTPSAASGRVTFFDGVTPIGDAALSGGVAVFTYSLPSGVQAITARYDGNFNFAQSVSAVLNEAVTTVPAGGFGSPVPVTLNAPATNLSAVDLNGDGKADLLACNGATGQLSIALGKGDGTFGTPQTISGCPDGGMPAHRRLQRRWKTGSRHPQQWNLSAPRQRRRHVSESRAHRRHFEWPHRCG